MSRWREVWRKSVGAFCTFCAERTEGEKEFERLLATYANDPMVVYERAEAYEHLGERDWARRDYLDAAARFVEPHWSEMARFAAEQMKGRVAAGAVAEPSRLLRERIHSLHAFPLLPPNVLADVLSGVSRLDSEPHLVAMNLRATVELLVWSVLDRSDAHPGDADELFELIKQLDQRRLVESLTVGHMHRVRKIGNRAAHGFAISKAEGDEQLRSFLPVVAWYCKGRWVKSRASGVG